VTRLVLAVLAVDDVRRSAAFYRDAFAWPVTVEAPSYVELAVPGGMRVGLYQRDGFARNTGVPPAPIAAGAVGPAELYLHDDDPGATIERVRRAGGRLLSPLAARDWGDEAAYFADPDGHVVVVARPLPG
jgi:catechol 2,3-dioxygenase-like lactoylglutathione lyase family enzyme